VSGRVGGGSETPAAPFPHEVVPAEVLRSVRRRFREEPGPVGDPESTLRELLRDAAPLLAPAVLSRTARHLAVDLVGLGPVERLLEDPEVTDVLVNGPGPVWVERRGRLQRTAVVLDESAVRRTVERMVAPMGVRADRTHPVVDARLADGTRVAAVLPPLAPRGTVLAVRRHRPRAVGIDELGDPEVIATLRRWSAERRNVVVYGSTGAGKTTVLDALLGELPSGERVVVVEDVAELRVPHDHVVRLEARAGTADGVGRVAIRELVRAALRLRPDRIVVGEVRGAEALDMVWALSTGHRGSMSTVHAATAADALARLDTFALLGDAALPYDAVRAQVRRAVDVLVGVARCRDGARRVVALHHVTSDGDLCPVRTGG
jgi:pilus assembly protein CpaF